MACKILVPQAGIDPGCLAVKAWSPNHWTARKFPATGFFTCPMLSQYFHSCPCPLPTKKSLAALCLIWLIHLPILLHLEF